MSDKAVYLAVDLGASSGRVMAAECSESDLNLTEIHRFTNPVKTSGIRLQWDLDHLFNEIVSGLKKAANEFNPDSIKSVGVDTWAVDYGLLDKGGNILGSPVCYRDNRTENSYPAAAEEYGRSRLYDLTGIQFLPFNTLYQLIAQRSLGEWPEKADCFLLMPDLINFLLCGKRAVEYTNATTTQLLDVRTGRWAEPLFNHFNLPLNIMPDINPPGTLLAPLLPELAEETGLKHTQVVQPATHDTASAVAGTPLKKDWAYISSGTWSLVGIESDKPVISEAALKANFTNEGGVDNSIRLLKNVTGLWIFENCRKEWEKKEGAIPYDKLIPDMEDMPPFPSLIDPDNPRFLNPSSMLDEIHDYLADTGQNAPDSQAGLSRLILDSMAKKYSKAIDEIEKITGNRPKGIHIVGGGCQNSYLNRVTAEKTALPVIPGPVEATALGNIALQIVADGTCKDLSEARKLIGKKFTGKSVCPFS